jgi:hypothetical protein
MDPVGFLCRVVSEMSKPDDNELDEPEREVVEVKRKRRGKDRSFKLMTAFRPARSR